MRTSPSIMSEIEEALRKLAEEKNPEMIQLCLVEYQVEVKKREFKIDSKKESSQGLIFEIRYYQCLTLLALHRLFLLENTPEKLKTEGWFQQTNDLYERLRHEINFSAEEQVSAHEIRVFLLALKISSMLLLKPYNPISILDSFYHFLCETQSYQNLIQKTARKSPSAFPQTQTPPEEKPYWNHLITSHIKAALDQIRGKEEFPKNHVDFIENAVQGFQRTHLKEYSLSHDLPDPPYLELQTRLLCDICDRLLSDNNSDPSPSLIDNQLLIAQHLFLEQALENGIEDASDESGLRFRNEKEAKQWKQFRNASFAIGPLLYLLHIYSETSDIGVLSFEKYPLQCDQPLPFAEQISKALRHLCSSEENAHLPALIRHLNSIENPNLKKILLYYLSKKAVDPKQYLEAASSIEHEGVRSGFDTLSAIYTEASDPKRWGKIKQYFQRILKKIPNWDDPLFILSFFFICQKTFDLKNPELSSLAKATLEKFKATLAEGSPNYSAILDQEDEACELSRISFCSNMQEARAIKAECQRKIMALQTERLKAKVGEAIHPMRKIEYKALSCFEIFADYEMMLIQNKAHKPIKNASEFFSNIEHMESVLIIDTTSAPEEQLFIYKIRVFLLALKLHAHIITKSPKNLIISAFFHLASEMQNYKNHAASILSQMRLEKKESLYLLGLISDATDLLLHSKQLRYRNHWCFVTMTLLSEAVKNITDINKKSYDRFEIGFVKHFSRNLSIPRDIIPNKNSGNTSESFAKLVCQDLIKILLFPKAKRAFELEKEVLILSQLNFIRLQLLRLYQDEKDPSKKEKHKKDLICVHHSLCENLPWLILYQHIAPSPLLSCLSVQPEPNFDAILEMNATKEDRAKSAPLFFLQELSEHSPQKSEMREYFKQAKRAQIPFKPELGFSVLAKFFIFCKKAQELNEASLMALVKSALQAEVLSVEEIMKSLEPKKSSKKNPPKNKANKKKKAKKTKPAADAPKPEENAATPSETKIASPDSNALDMMSDPEPPLPIENPEPSPPIAPATPALMAESQNPSTTRETLQSPTLSVNDEVDTPKPPRIKISEYLSTRALSGQNIYPTHFQTKCHPVHQLIQALNAEASSDNDFKFATFLSGGALLYYFVGYYTIINDYDLRCYAPLPEIEALLKVLQNRDKALGIAEISCHGIHTQHPLLRLRFSKYPGLLVELSSMMLSTEKKSLLECIQQSQEQETDFIPNSLFYTECSSKEFLLDFQGAIQALQAKPRLLNRTPFEHPPENKVLIILRGLKFLVKYPDFWPSMDLITWIKNNMSCFKEVDCFQTSAHAFLKLIYSGLLCKIFYLMPRIALLDLLDILCPPLYRHMQSEKGFCETLNIAHAIDSTLSAGFKEREAQKGEYWRVLHDALFSLLCPIQHKINLAVLPTQIDCIRKKEKINWAEFWKPIDSAPIQDGANIAAPLLN